MARRHRIAVARGDEQADLVLRGGEVLSVFTGEVCRADVAIVDGFVVGVGDYQSSHEIDVSGKLLIPGLIDGHCHIESSKLSVAEFARAVLRCGTTTVVVDPHELANVLGVAGIQYVLDASEDIPLDVRVMVPSCVPASQFETAYRELTAADYVEFMAHPRVVGLAEMMNYPAVIAGADDVLQKMAAFGWRHIDGHAPSLTGRQLNAYLVGGPSTDHECTTYEEALEKRRLGMWIMIREASMIRNMEALLPLVERHGTDNTCFVTDDREADTLLTEGHMNAMVRLAVNMGLSLGDAVKLATLNVARCHGLDHLGAIAPGYRADVAVLPDAVSFQPDMVLQSGRVVVQNGSLIDFEPPPLVHEPTGSVILSPLDASSFALPEAGRGDIRVIELIPDQVVTRMTEVEPTVSAGLVLSDPSRDLAKLAVIERHHGTERIGIGFVRGFGLRHGAMASTVSHDAHNLVVAGVDDEDMLAAVRALDEMQGGLVAVDDGQVIARLPLPIAGLMSDAPATQVVAELKHLEQALRDLGVGLETPFMYLGFLALSVIPELRLTDQGLVDVKEFRIVPLQMGGS